MGVARGALILWLWSGLAEAETSDEFRINAAEGTIEVGGAGAPDLHAPSAQIGRVQAERRARTQATIRLRAGVKKAGVRRWGCKGEEHVMVERALESAEVAEIDWGSDGSVMLILRLRISDLVCER